MSYIPKNVKMFYNNINCGAKYKDVYISDANNKRTNKSGRSWAGGINCIEIERDNVPMKNLKILSLEHRGEGGRAYKTVDEDGYRFDLREDELVECMEKYGIDKGSILKGEFVFAKVAAQMKVILVGSKIHKHLKILTELKERDIIKNKDLKYGHIYLNKKNEKSVYLGQVKTFEFNIKYDSTNYCNNICYSNLKKCSLYYTNFYEEKFDSEITDGKHLQLRTNCVNDAVIDMGKFNNIPSQDQMIAISKQYEFERVLNNEKYYSKMIYYLDSSLFNMTSDLSITNSKIDKDQICKDTINRFKLEKKLQTI
jgi:hypothetical protein